MHLKLEFDSGVGPTWYSCFFIYSSYQWSIGFRNFFISISGEIWGLHHTPKVEWCFQNDPNVACLLLFYSAPKKLQQWCLYKIFSYSLWKSNSLWLLRKVLGIIRKIYIFISFKNQNPLEDIFHSKWTGGCLLSPHIKTFTMCPFVSRVIKQPKCCILKKRPNFERVMHAQCSTEAYE